MSKRVMVATAEADVELSLLQDLATTPTVGLRDAVASAARHSLCNNHEIQQALEASLLFATHLVARGKAFGLNVDQAAAVHLYSQEMPHNRPFYSLLNGALGGWGRGGHAPIKHYHPYIKLALGGIALLPKEEGLVVYRGVLNVSLETLLCGKQVGGILTWWAFTSTTGNADVLRDPTFLGIGPQWGARTVFKITTKTGVRIKHFSDFGADFEYYLQPAGAEEQNEDEILIAPGTQFEIVGIETYTNNVTEVELVEVGSLLNGILGGAAAADSGGGAVGGGQTVVGVGATIEGGGNASSSEDDDDDRGDSNGIDRTTSSTNLL
eukprot:gene12328-1401_t